MEELQSLLSRADFPEGGAWQRRRYQPNESILAQGEPGHQIFILLSGSVRVSSTVALDSEKSIHPGFCDLTPGSVFGELCLFDDEPRSASVTAVTESEVAVIDRDALRRYLEANPETGYRVLWELIHTLVDRLRTANRRFASVFSWGLKAHGIDKHL